jgi:membrane protein involved in colicin uptake
MNFDPAQIWAPFGGTKEDSDKLTAYFETRRTATQAARDELEKLSDMAADEKASDADVAKALAAFRGTRDKAKAQLEADRAALVKDLDLAKRPKLEAALTAFGILDNGIGGPRMGRGGFGGGRGGGGGGGGGFGGGQGGGPGGGGGMGGPGGGTGGPGGGPGGGGAGGPGSGAQGL